jgi:hypothetical protein
MQGDLALKRAALRRAGANLAVSAAIAEELRAAGIPRVEVIPNVVDPVEVRAVAAGACSFPLPERFLLFIGKLEENKGAVCSSPPWPPRARACPSSSSAKAASPTP